MKYVRRQDDSEYSSDHFIRVVKSIGKLAFETLLSGKSLFRKSQVVEVLGPNAFDFGILIGHEDVYRLIRDETADIFVTFAHRSIQEFLGAFFFIFSINEGLSIEGLLGNHCGEPIFLKNPLFFHFCAWLIFSKRDVFDIENLNRACDSLRQFIVERIDFRQLDLEGITREYPAIDLEKAVRRNDEANLKLITGLVSECKCVEHLIVPRESDQWLLQAIKHLPQSIATVALGSLLFCTPPSGISNTEINLVVANCTSETLKEVKNIIMESANVDRTFRVFLLDFYYHRKSLNITNLLGKIVKELHTVTSEAAHLHFQGPLDSCRLLTHLSLFRMTTLAQFALINALEDMSHLRHLTIGETILSDGKVINVLPSCSNLTHLGLF